MYIYIYIYIYVYHLFLIKHTFMRVLVEKLSCYLAVAKHFNLLFIYTYCKNNSWVAVSLRCWRIKELNSCRFFVQSEKGVPAGTEPKQYEKGVMPCEDVRQTLQRCVLMISIRCFPLRDGCPMLLCIRLSWLPCPIPRPHSFFTDSLIHSWMYFYQQTSSFRWRDLQYKTVPPKFS